MTKVSRKGFVDKNGNQVSIVPNVPGATEGNIPIFDENGNLHDSGISSELVGKEIHALEFEDGSYESSMGVGQLNRDDDELDGASIYGKDAIRLGVYGNRVFIDGDNINNLNRAIADPVKSTDASPTYSDDKLITAGAVKAALEGRIGTIGLHQRAGDSYYFLYGSGEDTDQGNINSVKGFIQATQADSTVLCRVHVVHDSGGSTDPDVEYDILGYAKWSQDGGGVITVTVVVPGYKFSCEVDGELYDADSYSDYWTKTSFSL